MVQTSAQPRSLQEYCGSISASGSLKCHPSCLFVKKSPQFGISMIAAAFHPGITSCALVAALQMQYIQADEESLPLEQHSVDGALPNIFRNPNSRSIRSGLDWIPDPGLASLHPVSSRGYFAKCIQSSYLWRYTLKHTPCPESAVSGGHVSC